MFKRLLVVVVALFGVFTLAACKGERTYKADGVYLAFSAGENDGAPQVTVVKVTIENDKIKEFYIDCLQSTAVKDEESNVTGYAFKEKTKKELGYDYRMHDGGRTMTDEEYREYLEEEGKLEWFEQAALIEKHFVEHGTDLTTDDDGYIQNVTGVTIADSDYSKLAKAAVDNAKAGKILSWTAYASGSQVNLVWAEGTVDAKGKLTSLKIDTLQGEVSDGIFAWNDKSKQELKYDYRMHDRERTMSDEEYREYLEEEGKLEWFEQADLLADYVLKNGLGNVKLDGTKLAEDAPEAISAVTVNVNHYVEVMKELLDNWK